MTSGNNLTIKKYLLTCILLLSMILPLVISSPVKAVARIQYTTLKYTEDYSIITSNLLSLRGKRTTDNDLYFLACTVRKHLERNEDPNSMMNVYPAHRNIPTLKQIEIVEDVINNTSNPCYDLYLAVPLSVIDEHSANRIVTVISNDIAFIDYDTFILMTVKPNL